MTGQNPDAVNVFARRLRKPGAAGFHHGLRRHGGMDEDNWMVDVVRYFIKFTHSESCRKCVTQHEITARSHILMGLILDNNLRCLYIDS